MIAPVALTMGEPAGIGGEVALAAWRVLAREIPLYFLADPDWLAAEAARGGPPLAPAIIESPAEVATIPHDRPAVLPVRLAAPVRPGVIEPRNADAVIRAITLATMQARAGAAAAIVTAPIVKSVLHAAGFGAPGHTEFIAGLCAVAGAAPEPLMLLVSERAGLRVALVSVHEPLARVPALLSADRIAGAGRRLAAGLRRDFGVARPRIAVAALNPHGGEGGAFGEEERAVIAPAVSLLRAEGVDATGPLPADTLFHEEARARHDAVLCMYHDQALIPLKTLDFHGGVNVTLNLPVVRASPDHGAALGIAGRGEARADSMIAAIRLAAQIAERRARDRAA